jgi:hypothetical protein
MAAEWSEGRSIYGTNNNVPEQREKTHQHREGGAGQEAGGGQALHIRGLRLDRSTARQIYGSIYLQRKQNLTSRFINPCSKGKMSL